MTTEDETEGFVFARCLGSRVKTETMGADQIPTDGPASPASFQLKSSDLYHVEHHANGEIP